MMTTLSESMNTQRHEEDLEIHMRRLLNYLIYRYSFYPRWTPHVNQLSLC